MIDADNRVVIAAALNGSRGRDEHSRVPYTPEEVASEACACAVAGSTIVHIHARTEEGGWSADPVWYGATIRRIRSLEPDVLVSITSIRPAGEPVSVVIDLLDALAAAPAMRPDLISINLGHIVAWEPLPAPERGRRTVHMPNDYEAIVALLVACRRYGIRPELGVMDFGFLSNAVALRDDGVLPENPWFLIELDSSAYGAGVQVAPSTVDNYDAIVGPLSDLFPHATWAAHGQGVPGYDVTRRALAGGAHVRVGFEDMIHLPHGELAARNADLVAWAAAAAHAIGRAPATLAETRRIVGTDRSDWS